MQAENVGLKTIDQFCRKHSISRSTFYRHPPQITKVGGASRIAPQHEAEWLASLPVVSGVAA